MAVLEKLLGLGLVGHVPASHHGICWKHCTSQQEEREEGHEIVHEIKIRTKKPPEGGQEMVRSANAGDAVAVVGVDQQKLSVSTTDVPYAAESIDCLELVAIDVGLSFAVSPIDAESTVIDRNGGVHSRGAIETADGTEGVSFSSFRGDGETHAEETSEESGDELGHLVCRGRTP